MELTVAPMDAAAAREIAGWRYPPPYDVYNIADEPVAFAAFVWGHERGYHRVLAGAELVGFCCFGAEARVPGGDYAAPAVDIGVGMRPDLTGRGQGRRFLDAVTAFAERELAPPALRLTVAAFNARAIRLYHNAGFRETARFEATFSGRPFVIMERSVDASPSPR
jgi:[ribosomal protein S18]-alanine N-acetyltransferase